MGALLTRYFAILLKGLPEGIQHIGNRVRQNILRKRTPFQHLDTQSSTSLFNTRSYLSMCKLILPICETLLEKAAFLLSMFINEPQIWPVVHSTVDATIIEGKFCEILLLCTIDLYEHNNFASFAYSCGNNRKSTTKCNHTSTGKLQL